MVIRGVHRQLACSSSLPNSFALISVMLGILSSSSDGWLFVMFYDDRAPICGR